MQEVHGRDVIRIDRLVVGGSAEPWERIGLNVSDNHAPLAGTGIEVCGEGEPGLLAVAASGIAQEVRDIDGVAVVAGRRDIRPPGDHPLGILSIDHVVINTDDLERTCTAIADTLDSPLKRVRELGAIRQGFHRVGPSRADSLILEVVERPDAMPGGASLWGFVLIVADIGALCSRLGPDVVSPPKDAVQPGRLIATVRAAVGLGVPVALMSPDSR